MTTIQVHLSDDLANKMSGITNNLEALIIDFLRSQVKELHLVNEYRAANDENRNLQKEFVNVDLAGWEDEY
jgi:hypothetical protein